MDKTELKRLIKIEDRIHQLAEKELGLTFNPIEFDIVPPQKMLEILAYNIPTNISNWKKGRDYEKERTVYDYSHRGLPYEVVIHSNPARAYLMNDNVFAVQCLVMAHVYGHCAFFTNNRFFQKSREDIISIMYEAAQRFNKYEKRFGIDEVEKTVDAAHALQLHSNPFDSEETEDEKRLIVFEQEKKKLFGGRDGKFDDVSGNQRDHLKEDVELMYQNLWKALSLKTPVQPTSDILRYVIDNSVSLQDWQKDILEVLRIEGQYYWPIMKTKFMNEGFAVRVHEKIMNKLFEENKLTTREHADYNYANSLVKAKNPFKLNPYSVGSGIWEDVEDRWDKGQHGVEWEGCENAKQKEEWDTKAGEGWQKVLETIETHTDWFFMHDFLLPDTVKKIGLYVYKPEDKGTHVDYVITKDEAKEIRQKIINAFAQNMIPDITVVDGNWEEKGWLGLHHNWTGINLEETYLKKTMAHIAYLWGRSVTLDTKMDDEKTTAHYKMTPAGEEGKTTHNALMNSFGLWGDPPSPLKQTYMAPWW